MQQSRETTVITFEQVKSNDDIKNLIDAANNNLKVMGYTEHGIRHVTCVSKTTANILHALGYDERTVELGLIAGWIHDIGNAINRCHHGITGASMAYQVLSRMGMPSSEVAVIIGAIGNHEESVGVPVNPVSAALIIADKSDAHRSRVRRDNYDLSDIHDRVNLSIVKNFVTVDDERRMIRLFIFMNSISSPMEYMSIYLERMKLCERAAEYLNCKFELMINGNCMNRRQDNVNDAVLPASEHQVTEEN